jgi:hypothetical protein
MRSSEWPPKRGRASAPNLFERCGPGSILVKFAMCQRTAQLEQWYDWPGRRDARWHLSAEEQHLAATALQDRQVAPQHAD